MVAYKSLKTKEKSSWVIPKVVAVAYESGRLQEFFITKFKTPFQWGFAKVVVTRAGRLQERSQGELRLYLYCVSDEFRNNFYPRGTASNF